MSNQYLSFDVTKQSSNQQLVVGRQGDGQLKFVTILFWDGNKNIPYDLTSKTIIFEALKPDDTVVIDENVNIIDAQKGLARYPFDPRVFGTTGTLKQAFFKITSKDGNGNQIADSTLELSIKVLSNDIENGIESETYLSKYDELISEVEQKFNDYAATVQDSIDKAQEIHDQIVEYTNLINSSGVITRVEFGNVGELKQPIGANVVEKINNEFQQRAINPMWFGLVGDGVVDDSSAVQKSLDEATRLGGGLVLFPPAKRIRIITPINVGSNTTVDFNGSEIIWDGSVQNNVGRFMGMFNAKGTITGEVYSATSVVLNTPGDNTDLQNFYEHDGYFSCDKASEFSIGDWVLFKINTGDYSQNSLRPKDEKLVKITDIKDTNIFINYSSPFEYEKYSYTATVQKIDPIFNVKFVNTKINDKKAITASKDPNNSHPDVLTFVSGISVQYAVNVLIDKVEAYNTKLPVLFFNHLNTVSVSRGNLDSAAIVGPGEGYYAQFNSSTNITFDKSAATKSRHLVDFTGSSFARVSDSSANRMYSYAFQLHGAYEHHILYFNSSGAFHADSGTIFGNANRFISFNKFYGWLLSNGYTADYVINDSDVKLMRAFTGLTVNNSKVLLDLGNVSNPVYTPDIRGTEKTYIIFNDSKIDIMAFGQSGIISGYDTFSFNNSVLRAKRDVSSLTIDGGFLIDFVDVLNVNISSSPDISRLKFRIKSGGGKHITFKLLGNIMYCTSSDWHLTARDLGTSDITVITDKNTFVNSFSTTQPVKVIYLPSSDTNANATQNIITSNNLFERATLLAVKSGPNDVFISDNNIVKSSSYTIGSDITHKKVNDIVI